MIHTSYIELNQENLNCNIDFIKSQLKNGSTYSMVIKGNAYGHGIEDIIPIVEKCAVNHFSVFSAEEAKRAHQVMSENSELMIMGFIHKIDLAWAIKNDIFYYVFNMERLQDSLEAAKSLEKPAKIHIELETGMNRTGFRKDSIQELTSFLNHHKEYFEIEGVCSHLAGAESASNYDRIKAQIKSFHELRKSMEAENIHPKKLHLACSAAALNYPETQLDLVRIGIANYGYWPSNELKMHRLMKEENWEDPLKAVLSWKSEIMSLNKVPEGEYVSYGKAYLTNRDSNIAAIPVGYGYGFSRDLSNLGRVLINGKRVPVVGVVNMNMFLVDVTDLPNVKVGDEVVLIGQQGDLAISVSSFSDMSNSLNYELLTRLPQYIPRLIVND